MELTEENREEIFKEGQDAYDNFEEITDCPYLPGSEEAEIWKNGFYF